MDRHCPGVRSRLVHRLNGDLMNRQDEWGYDLTREEWISERAACLAEEGQGSVAARMIAAREWHTAPEWQPGDDE